MFLTMSVGLTLTMFIPQELGHVLKKDFLHQLMLPHCSGLSSLLAAPLMTQSPCTQHRDSLLGLRGIVHTEPEPCLPGDQAKRKRPQEGITLPGQARA